jgi:hypothetical protein
MQERREVVSLKFCFWIIFRFSYQYPSTGLALKSLYLRSAVDISALIEPECSLSFSQKFAISTYPEPVESS